MEHRNTSPTVKILLNYQVLQVCAKIPAQENAFSRTGGYPFFFFLRLSTKLDLHNPGVGNRDIWQLFKIISLSLPRNHENRFSQDYDVFVYRYFSFIEDSSFFKINCPVTQYCNNVLIPRRKIEVVYILHDNKCNVLNLAIEIMLCLKRCMKPNCAAPLPGGPAFHALESYFKIQNTFVW